jgi:hypothetical protein
MGFSADTLHDRVAIVTGASQGIAARSPSSSPGSVRTSW